MITRERRTSAAQDDAVIHVVDDEKDIVQVATRILERNGYSVHSFSNATEALSDIEVKCREKVSMLITDVRMPGHSGFEVARRTRVIVPDVPVIFMTAFEINDTEFGKLFPSLHVNEFLQKPFDATKLLKVVQRYCLQK